MKRFIGGALALLVSPHLAAAEPISADAIRAATGGINTATIIENDASDQNWLNYGLNYAETRYSQLDTITADNVGELGLAWSYNLESRRGVQATPIVADGVMYVTASWSVVHALDAITGEKLWVYDPEVPANMPPRVAATSSTGALPSMKARSSLDPMTAICMRWMLPPVSFSGRSTPLKTGICPTP